MKVVGRGTLQSSPRSAPGTPYELEERYKISNNLQFTVMWSTHISVLRYFLTANSTSQVSVVRSQGGVLLTEIKNN